MTAHTKPIRKESNINIRVTAKEKTMIKDTAARAELSVTDMVIDAVKEYKK